MESNGNCNSNSLHNGKPSSSHTSLSTESGTSPLDVNISDKKSARDYEILRIMGQYLSDLGFRDTYISLVNESGIVMEHKAASALRESILNGQWENAESAVNELSTLLNCQEEISQMRFLILEQRYLEHIEDDELEQALIVLRNQITPLGRDIPRVHVLASCLMCQNVEELKRQAKWSGKHGGSRQALMEKLQLSIPAAAMLPPRRLQRLMEDASAYQVSKCRFHNSSTPLDSISLLADHECAKSHLPTRCLQTITQHNNEVWVCQFSPSGDYLATGGKDCLLNIWMVDKERHTVQLEKSLDCQGSIKVIAWSPDSNKIAVCTGEDNSYIFVYHQPHWEKLCRLRVHEEDVYSALVFLSDSRRLAFGGLKGQTYIIDTDDKEQQLAHIEGYRIQNMACATGAHWFNVDCDMQDEHLLLVDTLHRVRLYSFRFGFANSNSSALSSSSGIIGFNRAGSSSLASSISGASTPTFHSNIISGSSQASAYTAAFPMLPRDIPNTCVSHNDTLFRENHAIHSIALSKDNKYALLVLDKMGITLWDIQERTVVARYRGFRQSICRLDATFGGNNEDFIACGSDDGIIHIWHRHMDKPVVRLVGSRSRSMVNCVHWNPALSSMMASVNDEGELKIWATDEFADNSTPNEDIILV